MLTALLSLRARFSPWCDCLHSHCYDVCESTIYSIVANKLVLNTAEIDALGER